MREVCRFDFAFASPGSVTCRSLLGSSFGSRLVAANAPACSMQDDRSSDDRSGFVDTADDAAEFEDSDFDDGGDAGFRRHRLRMKPISA
jgi:hypothetical protein